MSHPLNINLKYGGEGGWDYYKENFNIQRLRALKGHIVQAQKRITNPEWFKNKLIKQGKTFSQRAKAGNYNLKGWPKSATKNAQSEKARNKRKETMKNKKHQQGKNNSQFGVKRIGINKEGKIKKIPLHELQTYLEQGWNKGFKAKL